MNNAKDIDHLLPKSWTDLAGETIHNHGLELALSALAVAAVVASRGKFAGAAERFLPKMGLLSEEGISKEILATTPFSTSLKSSINSGALDAPSSFLNSGTSIREELVAAKTTAPKAETAAINKLNYDFDPTKVQTAFGAEVRALPSMSIVGGKLEQRVTVVDSGAPVAKLYDQVNPAVFHLHEMYAEKEYPVGTAFLSEDNCLITAQHCTLAGGKTKDLFIRLKEGGERLPLNVVARDYGADVAILKFKEAVDGLPKPIELGWSSDLSKAGNLTNFGYPASANRMVVTEGLLNDIETIKSWANDDKELLTPIVAPTAKLLSRADVYGGNSGGPTMAGDKVVGVVTTSMHDLGLSRSTAIEHARLLMDQVRKHPDLDHILQVHSIGRVLGTGKNFTVKVEKLDVAIGDTIEKPTP